MSELYQNAQTGHSLTGLDARFIFAWWAAENGYEWPSTNNPGNISYPEYQGNGENELPSGGVFTGVVHVNPENKVCTYGTALEGIEAWAELLRAPTAEHGGSKYLTVDLSDLVACENNLHSMAIKVGSSNWAASHYVGEGPYAYPGGTIVGAYESTVTASAFAPAPVTPAPAETDPIKTVSTPAPLVGSSITHDVAEGDTLSEICLRYHVPLSVTAIYNGITDVNHIEVGEEIKIPRLYVIKPGDTLSLLSEHFGESVDFLAHLNGVNPDRITAGHNLFY